MNDQQDLEGLSALVTGATSGIGKAAAEELGRHGAEIVVHGRDADRGSAVVDTITAEGGKARFVAADRGIGRGDLRPAVRRQRPGGVLPGRCAGPEDGRPGSGSIISLGSMAGQIGLAGGAAYGATKATLAAMTRSWAAEFSPAGVRVNAIAAGPVLTNGAAPARIEALGATALLARAAQPGEIASVIAFLASPKASYLTGAVIAADGGHTAI